MKVLKATTAYKSYLEQFFRKHRELHSKSYAEQAEFFFGDAFGWANFWEAALAPLGWQVFEVVANAEPIQTAWADEQGLLPSKKRWVSEILLWQIRHYQPDILFLEDYSILSDDEIKEVRKQCKSIRLVVSWCGAPYAKTDTFSQHDLVLSCVPEIVDELRRIGCKSEHLHHAFFPGVLKHIESIDDPSIPLSFIGQIVQGSQQHVERGRLLEAIVSSEIPLEIYTPSHSWSWKEKVKSYSKRCALLGYPISRSIRKLNVDSESYLFQKLGMWKGKATHSTHKHLIPYFKEPVFGLDMFKVLRKSQVTFNCHIDISRKSASNMRLFEATGVGSCLLTDAKENLRSLFEPDYEVVTYASSEECIEKAKWLLESPEKREIIAQAGQKRTISQHTFENRAVELIALLNKHLE